MTTDGPITFGANVDPDRVTTWSREVLKKLLTASGNSKALVMSAGRTPADCARIMFGNLTRAPVMVDGVPSKYGVAAQRKLYFAPGNAVIDVFVDCTARGLKPADTMAAMEAKVIELGPVNVSHHCADPLVLQVLDVDPNLEHPEAFDAAVAFEMRPGGAVSKYLHDPRTEPAKHIEIPQPQALVA